MATAEFRALWAKVSARTRYKLAFTDDELLANAVENLRMMPDPAIARVTWASAELIIVRDGVETGKAKPPPQRSSRIGRQSRRSSAGPPALKMFGASGPFSSSRQWGTCVTLPTGRKPSFGYGSGSIPRSTCYDPGSARLRWIFRRTEPRWRSAAPLLRNGR